MASSELEEKINKIRLQNEEIKRRYEEVEADKKNAAKLNALVQLVPSDDWPERKEPPEFSAPPKNTQKQKINKEHNDRSQQHYSGAQDRHGKKDHKFAQGDGPPPDPKYNFLADSEREMRSGDDNRPDEDRSRNKTPRGGRGRRGGTGGGNGGAGSREAFFKDNRGPHAFHSKDECLPEYEAWRAERNRIDEARINRQKTAEGNWRREWDNNKTSVDKEPLRRSESSRKDSSNYERRNNHYENDFSNRGHGGTRTYHGSQKNHGHQDYRRPHPEQPQDYKRQQSNNKAPLSPTDDRTVSANDKSIKVTVNHANQSKAPVMSVKVNSPSIAGTGRVGPRQKSRITYSSQSDADVTTHELNTFSRQKSFDEKTAAATFNSSKPASKSPFPQRKKDSNSKSPFPQRKEFKNDESSPRSKNQTKAPFSQRNESKDQKQSSNYTPKQQRTQRKTQKLVERLENVSPDEALPSEYSPDKSFNNENSTNRIFNNGNINIENALNKSNEVSTGSSNTSVFLNDSIKTTQFVDESICNTDNATCENKEEDKIDVEDVEIKEDIQMNENINEIKVEDKFEDINQAIMSDNVSLNDSKETGNSEKTPDSENSETLEQKIEVILKEKQENKTICVSVSQHDSEILQNQQNDEPKVIINNESQKVVDLKTDAVSLTEKDNLSEIIKSEKLGITDMNISEVKSLDQSNIADDTKNTLVKSDETKLNEMIQLEESTTGITENDSLDKSDVAAGVKNKSIESKEDKKIEIGISESEYVSNSELIQLEQQSTPNITKNDSLNESGIVDDIKNELVESQESKIIEMNISENKSISDNKLIQLEQQSTPNITENDSLNESGIVDDIKNELVESQESKIIEMNISENKSISHNELIQLEEQMTTDITKNDSLEESGIVDDNKIELIESEESKVIKLNTSENKSVSNSELIQLEQQPTTDIIKKNSLDKSGIVDDIKNELIESDEAKLIVIDTCQNSSVNDSGLERESNKVKNNIDASIVEFSTEKDTKTSPHELEKSDLVEPTKEICEKTIEICDIHSAASSESSQKDEPCIQENEEKSETYEMLEKSTKDSNDDINGVNESSEPSKIIDLKQVTVNESSGKEESIKEELTNVATDESKKE